MYGLYGKIQAQPGQRDALIDVLVNAAKALEALDGCYLYVVSSVPDEPDSIWVTEVWRSQADHQASLGHEAIKALISVGRPLIAAGLQRIEVTPVGGKGLPGQE